MNSFHITLRTPPEILGAISSYLTEEDLFSASQVCQRWRSVLTSSASLWTRISYKRGPSGRPTASLERCGPLPIQLRLEPPFQSAILEDVLPHGNKVLSLTANHSPSWISQLQPLFAFSRPSVERLLLYSDDLWGTEPKEQVICEMWQDFPLLRELLVRSHCVPIGRFTTPNLVHLALEYTGSFYQNVTVQTILDALRGCPLLETLLLDYAIPIPSVAAHGHSPVHLPRLRCIEVGSCEVQSGLITHLDFPPDVAAGFRLMYPSHLWGQIPDLILYSVQHVLRRIRIRCITLATCLEREEYCIRFEGLRGSLEITTVHTPDGRLQIDLLFGPEGVLFSHSPDIENVTEIHVVGCPFDTGPGLDHVKVAMPNVDTISFFECDAPRAFELLTSENLSLLPFPRLERVMVLGEEFGLEDMARRRRDLGVPLKTLVIGRDLEGLEYDHTGDYAALGELVDDLRVECPVEILGWGSGNKIIDFWSEAATPSFVSPGERLITPYLINSTASFHGIKKQL